MKSITQRDRSVNRSPVPEHADVSAEILAANQQLLTRRAQGRHSATPALQANTQPPTAGRKLAPASGWLTALHTAANAAPSSSSPSIEEPVQTQPLTHQTITVLPTMASAFQKQACVAEARLWYLCRLVDSAGRGWLDIADIRAHFAHRESELRIAGWRRVRQLLQRGKGVFWQQDNRGRVWLNSAEKVAAKLDITRLSGRPVQLPVTALTANLRTAKAHLYATFHSGRDTAPISRHTLSAVTGVPERTQRSYDALASVPRQSNVAVGAIATADTRHEHFAQRPGAFELIDHKGKQGPAGTRYQAWRLPNSYGRLHKTCLTGHQKRINRRLRRIDLANQRAQGNGATNSKQRLFFDTCSSTLRVDAQTELYYYNAALGVWHCLGHKVEGGSNK